MPDGAPAAAGDPAAIAMQEYAEALAGAVEELLPGWVERAVRRRAPGAGAEVEQAARAAGRRAAVEVGGAVRRLLAQDVDDQRANPLALLRDAVRYPTEVLRRAGIPPVARDDFARDRFPADDYDLVPATWSDIDPALSGPGIAWGAAKAFVHKSRHAP